MKKRRLIPIILVWFVCFNVAVPSAEANPARIARGLIRTVGAVFEIPKAIITESSRVMFPVSILTGTMIGTVRTVTGAVGGVVDVATGALPYAKYAAMAL